MTETANMGRRAAIYNETYLCCSSSLVPRRVRRGEEIGESGERGEERGVRRVWWGEKLARQPSDLDQLSSPCPHLYLAVSRSFIRQRPTESKPSPSRRNRY